MDRNRHCVAREIAAYDKDRDMSRDRRGHDGVDLPQAGILRNLAAKLNLGRECRRNSAVSGKKEAGARMALHPAFEPCYRFSLNVTMIGAMTSTGSLFR
jgi:hypothetical protein